MENGQSFRINIAPLLLLLLPSLLLLLLLLQFRIKLVLLLAATVGCLDHWKDQQKTQPARQPASVRCRRVAFVQRLGRLNQNAPATTTATATITTAHMNIPFLRPNFILDVVHLVLLLKLLDRRADECRCGV